MAKPKNVIEIVTYVIKKYGQFHAITKKYTAHNKRMTHTPPKQGNYGQTN